MADNTNLYDSVITCFHQMIAKYLKLNNNVYKNDLADKIGNILLGSDELDKQLFFDFFQKVQTNDKRKIINICLFNIVSKIDIIACNCDKNKINDILDVIEKNRNLIIDIHNFIIKRDGNKIPNQIMVKLNNLNEYEQLAIDSICLNICSFTFTSIQNRLKNININFYTNPQSHKWEIVKLLKFYIPIYNVLEYIKTPKVEDENSYVTIYPINNIIKLYISKQNNIAWKTLSPKIIIYYLFYQFLINLDFDENCKNYINRILLMIEDNNLNMDEKTFNYLLDFYQQVDGCYSVEEKINAIKELKKSNLDSIINLYASFDIAEYEQLQKKKKAFGL